MCVSYFPFHSELGYRQNLFTAACTDLHQTPFKISIFSLSLVQLLVQQSQPEVQEFKLLAALFPSLATEYGK